MTKPCVAAGGLGVIGITTNAPNCSWTATTGTAFAALSPPGGNGSGQVTVTLTSNAASTTSRTGSLTISGQLIGFAQAGTLCTYQLRSTTSGVPAAGGLGTVSVVAPAACSWTAA